MLYSECEKEMLPIYEKTGKYWGFEKVDGDNFKIISRTLRHKQGHQREIRLINRHGNDYTGNFPEIVAGIKKINVGFDFILNCEIAFWNEERQMFDFNIMRGRQGLQKQKEILRRRLLYPCSAYVFDLIQYGDFFMTNNPAYPFEKRYRLLKQLLNRQNENTIKLLPIRTDLVNFFDEECKADREGIVIKNVDNIYCNERTKSCLKVKNYHYSNVLFSTFIDNPSGIKLENQLGDKVQVANKVEAEKIKAMILQGLKPVIKVKHLQKRTDKGRFRQPIFVKIER